MERLIDYHIRDIMENTSPLHPLQFAYMKGKSTELAAHHLVSRLERSLERKGIALCAFMDIQGAFDNTAFYSIKKALSRKGVDPATIDWILSMLRLPKAALRVGFYLRSSGLW